MQRPQASEHFHFCLCRHQTLDIAAMQAPGVCASIMTARNKKNGFGTISNPERFLNQDFQQIRQSCQIRKCGYIDSTFPPDRRSIGPGVLRPEELNIVQWKRPYVSVFMAQIRRRRSSSSERQSQLVKCLNCVKCEMANVLLIQNSETQSSEICIVSSPYW